MDLHELDTHLRNPATYPAAEGRPELIHTHCSVVALVGDEVFKVKREVRHAFLDFSTPELRLAAAREELRLNARLAKDTYLGLMALMPQPNGAARFEPFDAAQDPPAGAQAVAVHMRRLSAQYLLDRRLERGEVDHELLGALARRLATFHKEAERGPHVDRAADPARLERLALDNVEALEGGAKPALSPELTAFLRHSTEGFFREHHTALAARVARGCAVDGHGDLHAGNVWARGSQLVIYDALEFDADLRRADQGLDLAFLLMDLDLAGHRASAAWLAREYARLAKDPDLEVVMPGFKTYRALVRAKVAGLRAASAELDDGARDAARVAGTRYALLAASYHLPPALVLMCGLPASGKSWLGERVARLLGATLHRSDIRRREVAPAGADPSATAARYSAEAKQRTYDALLAAARTDLDAGRSAVIDGSFIQARWRAPFVALAAERGAPLVLLEPRISADVARERLARRAQDPREPSEADWTVYQRLAGQYEAPVELAPGQHVLWESGGPAETATVAVVNAITRQARG